MRRRPPASHAPPEHLGPMAWGLLAVALLWYWGLVWSLNPLATIQASLHPHPDAAQYLDTAVNLVEGSGPGIHLAGETLPSRFPPGYSAVIAAVIGTGAAPLEAPYLVNKGAGLLLLLSVFLIAGRAGGLAGGLASFLLVTRSSFIVLARSPMAEIVTMLAVLWGAVLLYDYARRKRRWRGAVGILLLTAAVSCRTASLPLLGLAPLAWWLRADLMARERRHDALSGCALTIAGLAPLLLYNTVTFGAPWRNGYDFWLGGLLTTQFSPANVAANLILYWKELTQVRELSTASLYAEGSFLAPAYVVLLLLALEPLLTRRVGRWFVAAGGAYGALLLFGPPAARLLFPLIVLSVPPVAAATVQCLGGLLLRRRWVPLGASWLLLVVTVVGWPGTRSDTDLGDLFRSHSLGWQPVEYEAVTLVQAFAGNRPWLLLTDLDPPYAHAVTTGDRAIAPLLDEHDYRYRPASFSFREPERRRLLQAALRDGRQVYAAVLSGQVDSLPARPAPNGHRWQILWRNARGGGVARLEPK